MQSFKDYCEDWIGLNRWQDEDGKFHSTPMERKLYYQIHMDEGITIEDSYKQQVRITKELIESGAMVTQ